METMVLILRLLFFAWILFLPQFLGILVHYRMKRFPRLAYSVGFMLTTIVSFYFMVAVFVIKATPGEYVCGLGGMVVGFLILFFTSIQMFISVMAQFWMRSRKILGRSGIN